jgi:hypothetical protein
MRPFESTLRECSVFFIVLFSFLPYFLYIFYQKFWEKSKRGTRKCLLNVIDNKLSANSFTDKYTLPQQLHTQFRHQKQAECR